MRLVGFHLEQADDALLLAQHRPAEEHGAAGSSRETPTVIKAMTMSAETLYTLCRSHGGPCLRVPPPPVAYSKRSVLMGSTRAARRAGSQQATSATATITRGPAMEVSGSSAPTPLQKALQNAARRSGGAHPDDAAGNHEMRRA